MDTLVQVAIVLWLPVLYIFIVLYCSYRLFYPSLRKILCPPQISGDFVVGNPEDPDDCRHARAIRTYQRLIRLHNFQLRYTSDFGGLTPFPSNDLPADLNLGCTLPHLHRFPSPQLSTGNDGLNPVGSCPRDGQFPPPMDQHENQQPPPYEDFEPPSYAETIKNNYS